MILDLFILGCLKEKPLNLDFLIETADFIKLNKWTTYKKELLLDKINTLVELNYISICKKQNNHFEKHQYVSTKTGIVFFRKELEKYIESEEVNMGMLILFLTFSNHFLKEEVLVLIEKKISNLTHKLNELQNVAPVKSLDYMSDLGHLSLKISLDFRANEIILYKDLLDHVKNCLNWQDYLTFQKENNNFVDNL